MKEDTLMYVANLVFKDNKGIVKKCVIFEKTEKAGQEAEKDKTKIEDIINSGQYFMFQNTCVNGKTHISLLEDYTVYTIKESEF